LIRVFIADDERPAREKLKRLLAREMEVVVVGEAADGLAAIRGIKLQRPDLAFLDISMPQGNGFDVVAALDPGCLPLVVFATAHDEFALKAFEVQALDYLLKPFTASRLAETLRRVVPRLRASYPAEDLEHLRRFTAPWVQRILVSGGPNREFLLPVAHIQLVRAQRNYLEFQAVEGVYHKRSTLAELEARLNPEEFLRINRSELVRLDAVKEFQPWFHGDYRLLLKTGATLTWSRRYRARRSLD
jgi:two-component system LytT family response regulator